MDTSIILVWIFMGFPAITLLTWAFLEITHYPPEQKRK